MGRAGAGGHSGGHSSGGHDLSSRSSGGHVVGSSSSNRRARAGDSYRGNTRAGMSYSHNHYDNYGYGPHYGPGYRRGSYYGGYRRPSLFSEIFSSVVTLIIVLVIVVAVLLKSCAGGFSDVPKSTYNREKVNTGVAYQNDCIVDEIHWFDNISKTEKQLQNFYNKTGVQPYVVLKSYDASLTTDDAKQLYAEKWYEDNIDNEGTFLFMYFAEKDVDNDVGYMCYVNGKQITSVMDSEAVDIFWAYIDENWYSDMSTDDMIVSTFDSTAKRIMTKTATGNDVKIYLIIGCVVIVLAFVGFKVLKERNRRAKEKAQEAKEILETPLEKLSEK